MPGDFNDEQVAALLAQEAKDASIKYSAMGLSAFMPAKPPINKPKPNTRFLRNLVRETDSHNAALLAREAAESRARLEQLGRKEQRPDHDIRRRQLGNITAVLSANATRKHRSENGSKAEVGLRGAADSGDKRKRLEDPREERRSKESHRGRRDRDGEKEDKLGSRSRRSHDSEGPHSRHGDRGGEDRKHRSRSRSPRESRRSGGSRLRERSPRRTSRRDRDRSRDDDERRKKRSEHSRARQRTPPRDDDSDPLEAIVGPLPPPKVKARGRGTTQASSGIDARFSEGYDPALDLSAGDGEDGDDWDMVLDRVKWRQQGAERLRAAGFTDKEVEGWESGKKPDFRWAKSGEGREWDRGKEV